MISVIQCMQKGQSHLFFCCLVAGIAVGQGTGRGGIGGTPSTIKVLVAVMVVWDWVAAGTCG